MEPLIRIPICATALLLVSFGVLAQDEKVDPTRLPAKVSETVNTRFPGAEITTATKTIENGEVIYDIEMTRRGRKHEIDIRENGGIVNFENQIEVNALPAAVTAAVRERYPKCRIKEAMETMVIKNNKDTLEEYEVLIETVDKKEVELTVSPDGRKIE